MNNDELETQLLEKVKRFCELKNISMIRGEILEKFVPDVEKFLDIERKIIEIKKENEFYPGGNLFNPPNLPNL